MKIGSFYNEDEVLESIAHAKASGERIVMTNGCFDILHVGHIHSLNEAKKLGDRLVVSLNNDDSVTRLKGKTRPFNKVENRYYMMSNIKSVDWVLIFSEDTPENVIRRVQPHVLVKGSDYKSWPIEKLPGAKYVVDNGGRMEYVDLLPGISTTIILERASKLMD